MRTGPRPGSYISPLPWPSLSTSPFSHQRCAPVACVVDLGRRRALPERLKQCVEFPALAREGGGTLVPTEGVARFDGALPNFAGLNCVEDREAVACDVARLLRPRARALVCL